MRLAPIKSLARRRVLPASGMGRLVLIRVVPLDQRVAFAYHS